jgi:hypothetical protein
MSVSPKPGLLLPKSLSFEHRRIHWASNLNAFGDGIRVLRIILTERRRTKKKVASRNMADVISFPRDAVAQQFYDRQVASAVSGELE